MKSETKFKPNLFFSFISTEETDIEKELCRLLEEPILKLKEKRNLGSRLGRLLEEPIIISKYNKSDRLSNKKNHKDETSPTYKGIICRFEFLVCLSINFPTTFYHMLRRLFDTMIFFLLIWVEKFKVNVNKDGMKFNNIRKFHINLGRHKDSRRYQKL